jgi:hypothetical protein
MTEQAVAVNNIKTSRRGERLTWKFVLQCFEPLSTTVLKGYVADVRGKNIESFLSHFRFGKTIASTYA